MFDPTSNQYLVKAADRFFITTKTLTPWKGGTQHWPILWWFYWTSVCDFIWLIFFFCPSISLWAFNELTNFWKSHSTWSKKMDVRSTHDVQLFDQKFHISFNLVPAWSKTMKDNMANCFGLIIALSSLKGYGGFEYFIWCCFRYGLEAIPHRQSNQKALVQVKCFTNILGKHEHLKWLYLDYKIILWSTSNLTFPLRS